MNYVKKMCILRQIKQGFSGDGKALTGLIKLEQYGKNLAIEVSVINFAPLSSGEYYCLIADEKGRTEMLPLRGKSLFNVITELDVSKGFCGVICFVKNGIFPIAYGANGDKIYDWRALVSDAIGESEPLVKPYAAADGGQETLAPVPEQKTDEIQTQRDPAPVESDYKDEEVAKENYYEKEKNDVLKESCEACEDDETQSQPQGEIEKTGTTAQEDDDADRVLRPFAVEPDGYYLSVKDELDGLFAKYPRDERLKGVFEHSEWVKIENENGDEQLVGVIYEDWKAKYVCYALPTERKALPPDEIKDVCVFVPVSPLEDADGYFVIFQSAATGECIKPQSV
jgi:hypothetical protein